MANLPVPESSGRRRHLYLVEIILGLAFVGLIAAIVWSNNGSWNESAKSNVVVLTARNWDKEIAQSKVPVLVEFWGKH